MKSELFNDKDSLIKVKNTKFVSTLEELADTKKRWNRANSHNVNQLLWTSLYMNR